MEHPAMSRKVTAWVYSITCRANGKVYIGVTCSIPKRRSKHMAALRAGAHSNHHLQRDFDAFGEGSFHFTRLEQVEWDDRFIDETRWMVLKQSYDPEKGYNSTGWKERMDQARKVFESRVDEPEAEPIFDPKRSLNNSVRHVFS